MTKQDKKILIQIRKHVNKLYDLNDKLSENTRNIETTVCENLPWFSELKAFEEQLENIENKIKTG